MGVGTGVAVGVGVGIGVGVAVESGAGVGAGVRVADGNGVGASVRVGGAVGSGVGVGVGTDGDVAAVAGMAVTGVNVTWTLAWTVASTSGVLVGHGVGVGVLIQANDRHKTIAGKPSFKAAVNGLQVLRRPKIPAFMTALFAAIPREGLLTVLSSTFRLRNHLIGCLCYG